MHGRSNWHPCNPMWPSDLVSKEGGEKMQPIPLPWMSRLEECGKYFVILITPLNRNELVILITRYGHWNSYQICLYRRDQKDNLKSHMRSFPQLIWCVTCTPAGLELTCLIIKAIHTCCIEGSCHTLPHHHNWVNNLKFEIKWGQWACQHFEVFKCWNAQKQHCVFPKTVEKGSCHICRFSRPQY